MNTQEDISVSIWKDKYRYGNEANLQETIKRVVRGVYKKDSNTYAESAYNAMDAGLWCPGGRILAGAGTAKRVTCINCYVNETVEDSMEGIMRGVTTAALTQQQGGGIGTDFSTIRPRGAIVKRTSSVSHGIIPFMKMWHAMCDTVKSSGSRRGAMMATVGCWHPDVVEFITAKNAKDVLTNFNVSVLVTDEFMRAVERDDMWHLGFNIPPADMSSCRGTWFPDDKQNPTNKPWWNKLTGQEPRQWFVYNVISARELWDMIIKNTYMEAEPGVIFIDRINHWNNLSYCEYIHCTNPCGEQPLPPNGDCNLGAVNLAKMVKNPFDHNCLIDMTAIWQTTQMGMRFLDNVLDISYFPTEDQKIEALNKRRTGIGITALGNMLQMMRIRYGSKDAIELTGTVMQYQRDAAYWASVDLAKERGPFPLFDKDSYLKGAYIKTLPDDLRDAIAEHGIRNGVLQTIAPTGTTSVLLDNVSSGIEPTFAWKYFRKVLQPDNTFAEFQVEDYGFREFRKWQHMDDMKTDGLPEFMVTATELTVDEHLQMQAACQKFIDASISKTINCPKEMSFEAFKSVYTKAYSIGLKGCTTYRPSGVRGAVLTTESQKQPVIPAVVGRPQVLKGITYKVKWPMIEQAFYVTINDYVSQQDGRTLPFEIFINSKSVQHHEWITALTRMISAIFRKGGDITFIVEELTQVFSAKGGTFQDHEYIPSLVAMIGKVIEKHMISIGLIDNKTELYPEGRDIPEKPPITALGEICPSCNNPTLFRQEGCDKCVCGFSNCGG